MLRLINSLLLLLASITAAVLIANPAAGLSSSEWKAGRIIDDERFFKANDMSSGEIQSFLNQKTPSCDTWGNQGPYYDRYGNRWNNRADYGRSVGVAPPYTCLKDYSTSYPSKAADNYCKAIPSGTKSSAELIQIVSDACGVSARALIVLLEKEQGLVTDDWPWPIQYRGATGYGCPDTAPCDQEYYGLFNQLYNAARQFKVYAAKPDSYRKKPYATNSILWNVENTGCGSGDVFIETKATAGLYNYTPYQPNKAALDNLYGSGDGCSAYGNRNFWRLYWDWFGPSTGDGYPWEIVAAHIYDEKKFTELPTDYLHKDERLLVSVKVRNKSSETWYRDGNSPTLLGSSNPINSTSKYCDIVWPQLCNRAARLLEGSVAPGGEGHFEFYIHAPAEGGEFRQYFRPVIENRGWGQDTGWHIYVNSTDYFDWSWVSFDAWFDEERTIRANMDKVSPGQNVFIDLKVKNKSATIWRNSGTMRTVIATSMPQDSKPVLYDSTWYKPTRPAVINESLVNPGSIGTFSFKIQAPLKPGEYRQYLKPAIETRGWMRDNYNHIYMKVVQ